MTTTMVMVMVNCDDIILLPGVEILQLPGVNTASSREVSSSSCVIVTEADCKISHRDECADCSSDWNVYNEICYVFIVQ